MQLDGIQRLSETYDPLTGAPEAHEVVLYQLRTGWMIVSSNITRKQLAICRCFDTLTQLQNHLRKRKETYLHSFGRKIREEIPND